MYMCTGPQLNTKLSSIERTAHLAYLEAYYGKLIDIIDYLIIDYYFYGFSPAKTIITRKFQIVVGLSLGFEIVKIVKMNLHRKFVFHYQPVFML